MAQQHEISEQHNTYPLPFLMDQMPNQFSKKAEKELNETPENRVELLKEMKEIIKTEKDINDVEFHDDFLQQFLRHGKYNVGKACTRLKNYVDFRRKNGNYFTQVSKDLILSLKSGKTVTILPWRCPDGCTLALYEYGNWNPDETSLEDLGRLTVMTHFESLRDPMIQINGLKNIYDLKDTCYKGFFRVTPSDIRLLYKGFMECFPLRTKELHFINVPSVFKIVWNVARPLLTEKFKKRVYFHAYPEDLLEHFPRSVLPSKYGGDLKNYFMTDWMIKTNEEFGKFPMGGLSNIY